MRYALALAMALGMGIASMAPAAHAGQSVDPAIYRDGQVLQAHGGGGGSVDMETGSALSTVAGTTPTLSDPYQELRYDNYGR
jgi:hypothetical protein